MASSIEQINALVLKYGLSETVRQAMMEIAYDAYQLGYSVALDKLE